MGKNQDLTAQEVIQLCQGYMSESNVNLVQKALEYATEAHKEQVRLSGEPYIIHPIQVAGILAQLKMDSDTVATGFLHDVVEDTEITLEEIAQEFSPTIAFLVDGVTKLGKVKFQSKEEQLAENHRKMLLAMSKDIRVIIVKLADRLHNMRTLAFQREEKQVEKSQEALDIYAPLADRLGMSSIKWELEDISLRYINAEGYYSIVRSMDSKRVEREEYIQNTIHELHEAIKDLEIDADIYGRPKHIYSIYRKMTDQKKSFEDIFDLLAIRVLVDTVKDCYAVLGSVHTKWKPMPGRFKDYIAMPKANMYQSIHTTVIGPEGKPVEIQIRTHQMHEVAEYGVAAHWAYKRGETEKIETGDNIEEQLKWFKDIAELQDDAHDASEFMDFVKEDIFKDQVYIFTPKGEVVELPKGSGPLDFAFHIHTEIGSKVVGAKVNGDIVPLDYKLKNGDLVEILTNANAKPSRDWLKLTQTSKARNRIKRYFKLLDREEKSNQGYQTLDKDLKAVGQNIKNLTKRKVEDRLLERFNYNNLTDLYAAIALGELSSSQVINFLGWKESEKQDETSIQKERHGAGQKKRTVHESGVVVEGANNLLIRLSQCCNPVPGDKIIGYITRGRGISVHRADCDNLKHEPDLASRTIDVYWDQESTVNNLYEAVIKVTAFDRKGLVNDCLHVVDHTIKHLVSVNGRAIGNDEAVVELKVAVENTEELRELMTKLKNIPDVYEVERMSN
ncbi:bifunctional (p)ppGpp synthetase/guanosine-3',5'-bis(diphosphate) 3'-pyrophosphohydrolase [Aerococcaceae bacterium DSM 111176]|nr:bifunctional (p)ppGpp synthetase/guanosine-3',5'-bis(diphosphate) 3'-pyrophosphohydrolase [Aerococcaceae bacterium DSM 111176]